MCKKIAAIIIAITLGITMNVSAGTVPENELAITEDGENPGEIMSNDAAPELEFHQGAQRTAEKEKVFEKENVENNPMISATEPNKKISEISATEPEIVNSTLEEEEEPLEEEPSEKGGSQGGKDVVYNVMFPTNIHAYLDPDNLSGKGQIFSDEYKIENYGNTDVIIKIKNVAMYWKPVGKRPVPLEETGVKDNLQDSGLKVKMVWKNKSEKIEKLFNVEEDTSEEYVLFLKAAEYDENGKLIDSTKGGLGEFYFQGSLDGDMAPDLTGGTLMAKFDYEIIDAGSVGQEEDGRSNQDDMLSLIEERRVSDEDKKK